jgi:hypothetical protein
VVGIFVFMAGFYILNSFLFIFLIFLSLTVNFSLLLLLFCVIVLAKHNINFIFANGYNDQFADGIDEAFFFISIKVIL